MAEPLPEITEEFRNIALSDRDIMLHILRHVEEQGRLIAEMHAELEKARPFLERATSSRAARIITGLRTGTWPQQ
jgi:hypothetical protein